MYCTLVYCARQLAVLCSTVLLGFIFPLWNAIAPFTVFAYDEFMLYDILHYASLLCDVLGSPVHCRSLDEYCVMQD